MEFSGSFGCCEDFTRDWSRLVGDGFIEESETLLLFDTGVSSFDFSKHKTVIYKQANECALQLGKASCLKSLKKKYHPRRCHFRNRSIVARILHGIGVV